MEIKDKPRTGINRPGIAALVGLAAAVGLGPFFLATGRPPWIALAALAAFLLALVLTPGRSSVTQPPGLGEYLLGGLGAIFPAALLGLVALAAYGLVYLLIALIAGLVRGSGPVGAFDPEPYAFYPVLALTAAVLVVVARIDAVNLAGQLYSRTAGLKSALFEFIARRGRRLPAGIAVVALVPAAGIVALVLTGSWTAWWANLLLLLYLIVASSFLYTISDSDTPRVENLDASQAVRRMFEARGFQVVPAPRTGREEIDPLLVSLDLFARKGRQAFAVEVQVPDGTPDMAGLTQAANLTRTAAWALEDSHQSQGEKGLVVEPLLVLIGYPRSAELRKWEKTLGMRTLIFTDPAEVLELKDLDDVGRLKKAAARFLAPLLQKPAKSGPAGSGKTASKG